MQKFVSDTDWYQQIEKIRAHVNNPLAGIFGPDSISWEVNRYMTIYLGAGRSVLLQLAHPWVAEAINQHSQVKTDPYGRLRRTALHVLTMLYGSMDQAFQSARHVRQIHSAITGKLSEDYEYYRRGSSYQANDLNALIWVYSTLLESSVAMYELFVRPLNVREKNQYLDESKQFASLFGIPESALPSNWRTFMEYNQEMWNSKFLSVGEEALNVADFLVHLKPHPVLRKLWWEYQVMTSLMMPPRLRKAYGLPPDTAKNRLQYEKHVRRIKKIFHCLPPHLRYLPPYIEAKRRLNGKTNPDFATAVLNKLLYGKSRLVL
ncbi:MAG: DUF2236 domain-containing protein [SAR324 cluster bacterium]|nr:DUF2236 domain-containing protein [SAR324 cluster bacterium]